MRRGVSVELLHLSAGLAFTVAIFQAARWAYPPARGALGWIGAATVIAVLAMGVARVRRAWRSGD